MDCRLRFDLALNYWGTRNSDQISDCLGIGNRRKERWRLRVPPVEGLSIPLGRRYLLPLSLPSLHWLAAFYLFKLALMARPWPHSAVKGEDCLHVAHDAVFVSRPHLYYIKEKVWFGFTSPSLNGLTLYKMLARKIMLMLTKSQSFGLGSVIFYMK